MIYRWVINISSLSRFNSSYRGFSSPRIILANLLRSRPVDIFLIILIITYTLLVFVSFALEDSVLSDTSSQSQKISEYIELSILGLFIIEIVLSCSAFGEYYIKDWWNVFDIFIIMLSVLFVLLEMTLRNDKLTGILKIRGLFRLLRIFLLFRKLNELRKKRDLQMRMKTSLGYNIQSILEKVLSIMTELRDDLDYREQKRI